MFDSVSQIEVLKRVPGDGLSAAVVVGSRDPFGQRFAFSMGTFYGFGERLQFDTLWRIAAHLVRLADQLGDCILHQPCRECLDAAPAGIKAVHMLENISQQLLLDILGLHA